jgi:hypothetical protein
MQYRSFTPELYLSNSFVGQVNLQITHSVQSENPVFFVMGIEGLAVNCFFAPKYSLGENFSTTLLLAAIQIAERNRQLRFYRVLKFPEVPDLSILRSNGLIRLR